MLFSKSKNLFYFFFPNEEKRGLNRRLFDIYFFHNYHTCSHNSCFFHKCSCSWLPLQSTSSLAYCMIRDFLTFGLLCVVLLQEFCVLIFWSWGCFQLMILFPPFESSPFYQLSEVPQIRHFAAGFVPSVVGVDSWVAYKSMVNQLIIHFYPSA